MTHGVDGRSSKEWFESGSIEAMRAVFEKQGLTMSEGHDLVMRKKADALVMRHLERAYRASYSHDYKGRPGGRVERRAAEVQDAILEAIAILARQRLEQRSRIEVKA